MGSAVFDERSGGGGAEAGERDREFDVVASDLMSLAGQLEETGSPIA